MAYSDFKNLKQLQEKFGILNKKTSLFNKIKSIKPSEYLLHDLQEAKDYPIYASEKAKSEFIITPLIKEIRRINQHFKLYSGYNFDVAPEMGLNGFCDYLLSSDVESFEINSPVFCLIEAKDRSVEEGFAQAGAEMYAAKIFNEKNGQALPCIYGCVTNAEAWNFLKLEENTLFIDDKKYYSIEEDELLPQLLGAFKAIVDFYD
jgi:hypothetical protein